MLRATSRTAAVLGPILPLFAVGCGGGTPLLHPAHPLPRHAVAFGAGASGHFALGDPGEAIETARSLSSTGPGPREAVERAYVEGALSQGMVSPGLAPWVGGRAGLGSGYEAGLAYQGRTLRLDGRHAWVDEKIAYSAGLGASAILLRPGDRTQFAGDPPGPTAGRFALAVDDVSATGFGFDVPLLVGYRSTGQVIQVWGGLRGGFELAHLELPLGDADESRADSNGSRWYGGGLLGFSVGLAPIWVAIELSAAYVTLSGTANLPAASGEPSAIDVTLSGWTVTPAGAVIAKF